jgi:HAD superfamily hydrolase (TIGR01549 family)
VTGRWVILDVGETLINETRIWEAWADELAIPHLTFFSALGAVIERGQPHQDVFSFFGLRADDWLSRAPAVEQRHGGFRAVDLYPDALPAIDALKADGFRLAVIGNQPVERHAQLVAIGVDVEAIAMSDEIGLFKPDPAFYARSLELIGSPEAGEVAYVGDRVDNDVLPAMAAGMRAVWIRRGPWGVIQRLPEGIRPALVVDSLDELAARIGEAWEAEAEAAT